ncbi:sigma-54-dependent transcriptional regulator [Alkalitalea saponilacus]|uniref:DNA-binding transcriptional response regulator, NtrC family, contains REC, AAA-type ATPase, and a Fis-type DNA-binding domains n=1 Tax=Alkalitalea saponilacus TaxID=889453 RepID=A0A1T5CYD5_9BACT|nr:sigma-54 dependent transcriptional regulator [Alkalitalea saponilacus]ASB50527.1 sigma-54-dependent Fis family transcriptional regulator [Alkalitalea saponilacus]SKB64353.1 DNA-binding transcriptional response regulator, NtrC family, contains REC, AAA-type ATPase, and a Fis-type DNA-binding domains [Alkalitalea saponilacus]
MKDSSIIIVDDNKSVLTALELLLCGRCKNVKTLTSPNSLLHELGKTNYDLLLLDMNYSAGINSGNEGIYWLKRVLDKYPSLSVIMITAYGGIELAVKAVRMGATDFITKPWENTKMLQVVESACRLSAGRKKAKGSASNVNISAGKVEDVFEGESESWKKVLQIISKVAATDANVLLTGENGTGKEVVAKKIHQLSGRKDKSLVMVDMGAIVEGLFESELFGHKKGAYTDAKLDRTGKIEEANEGTLFLDEIGNLPLPMQAKLLTVLQSRTVTRLGENEPRPVNIRLLSATNGDLPNMVETGHFREDLLYRLNTIHIEIPPLRQRKADIPGFVNHFLLKYTEKYNKTGLKISDSAMELLFSYNWPGNVRELQHAIEKAVILSDQDKIQPADFMFREVESQKSMNQFSGTLEEMEKSLIEDAIMRHQGNMSSVAMQLGITRQTLYNKIKKYDL